jgi:hypothetical protein
MYPQNGSLGDCGNKLFKKTNTHLIAANQLIVVIASHLLHHLHLIALFVCIVIAIQLLALALIDLLTQMLKQMR